MELREFLRVSHFVVFVAVVVSDGNIAQKRIYLNNLTNTDLAFFVFFFWKKKAEVLRESIFYPDRFFPSFFSICKNNIHTNTSRRK